MLKPVQSCTLIITSNLHLKATLLCLAPRVQLLQDEPALYVLPLMVAPLMMITLPFPDHAVLRRLSAAMPCRSASLSFNACTRRWPRARASCWPPQLTAATTAQCL